MAKFAEFAGFFAEFAFFAIVGVAVLAPLTWPLLIAALIAYWQGRRQWQQVSKESRNRLITAAIIQSIPSVIILLCGAADHSAIPRGRSFEYVLPYAFLAQLPVSAVAFWWCQHVGWYSIAVSLVWASYSLGAVFCIDMYGRPL